MNDNKQFKSYSHQKEDVSRRIADEIKNLPSLKAFYGEPLVKAANELGNYLKNMKLKTSQIRKFLDAVKKLKYQSYSSKNFNFRDEAMMIKPKLAYASGRQDPKYDAVRPLMTVMNVCIDKIQEPEDFENFFRFVEAIVAYHKFYGGKEL